jgi:hypothetical protein
METEIKKKKPKRRKGSPVTLTLRRIPGTVHEFLYDYRRAINGQRRRDYNIKQAYVEFLIECVTSRLNQINKPVES